MKKDKLKLVTILGTRPEIIKLAETIKDSDKYFDHSLVHTGQNYDYTLNEIFFEEIGIRKPDYFLDCVGSNLGDTMGNVIAKSYEILQKLKPDAVLILGDTNSALSAISAKRLKIPIFHMEAGNRCFDENLPEEINRKIVDHISDVNLPYSSVAKQNLLTEGVKPETIFITGSPMKQLIDNSLDKINNSDVLTRLKVHKDGYMLVSAHREENVDSPTKLSGLIGALNSVAEKYNMPLIFSTHPRTKDRIEKTNLVLHKNISSMKPFGFYDYNKLQLDSFCVLSDSGTLAEESSILGFYGISLRTSTERQEAISSGSFIIGGVEEQSILQSIELSRKMKESNEAIVAPLDYSEKNVSLKIVKIIQSYTKIISQVVWGRK